MICCILAGGFATRLYPLTQNRPKALLDVGGKPILEYLLDDIQTIPDIERIIIVTNQRFHNIFADWIVSYGPKVSVSMMSNGAHTPEDSAGAVAGIVQVIETYALQTDLLILAADNLLDFSLRLFTDYQKKAGGPCVMWHPETRPDRLRRTGVALIENGKILRMEEKPERPFSQCAIPPFYIYTSDLLESILRAPSCGCRQDSPGHLLEWLSRQHEINAMPMPGTRQDIGDLQTYLQIKSRWENREAPR